MLWSEIFLCDKKAKALDTAAINSGISEYVLMKNAAHIIYTHVISLNINSKKITVLCGIGKNGGDGYAIAAYLKNDGYDVSVICIGEPCDASSAECRDQFTELGGWVSRYSDDESLSAELITKSTIVIDALYGFSFKGEFCEEAAAVAELANAIDGYLISVDLPSGVAADGTVCPGCICADITYTLTVNKNATCSYPGLDYCGEVVLCDIGIPESAMNGIEPAGYILNDSIINWIPQKSQNTNKTDYGTLFALCGSANMPGAAYLAAMGALRSGIGLLKLTSDKETLNILKYKLSEAVYVPFGREEASAQKYDALLLGCGIGRNYDNVLAEILTRQKQTTIIDADGINYIASHINVMTEMQGDIILTPHEGEMARLLDKSVDYVKNHRIECARAFAMEFGCVLVLKGSRTVIAVPGGTVYINTTGNTALATGGSGDVLAGVIASLAAQGLSPRRAACLGVYIHGLAADRLISEYGKHGLLPSDLPKEIGRILG